MIIGTVTDECKSNGFSYLNNHAMIIAMIGPYCILWTGYIPLNIIIYWDKLVR